MAGPVSGGESEERSIEAGIGAHLWGRHRLNLLWVGGGPSGPLWGECVCVGVLCWCMCVCVHVGACVYLPGELLTGSPEDGNAPSLHICPHEL